MTRTLFITGIDGADALLNRDGTALMIGMLLDQQVPMEWAFTGPYTLRKRLGHLNAKRIAAMNLDKFVALCSEKPAIHRFPRSMGTRVHQLCVALTQDHGGKAVNVWNGVTDAEELMKRLRKLPGFGEEKAQIFIALLGKRFGVRPRNWRKFAGVFSDTQPRSVADIYSPATLLKVRGFKQMQRALDHDKQDRPKVKRKK
ncbi:MAG: Fe-S cluster assembly protein HesB [Acidimicrobiaceae bacterium]|nr:Fe-S cluster assembly protein HesB [Acidimicrobiaceae bacterium]